VTTNDSGDTLKEEAFLLGVGKESQVVIGVGINVANSLSDAPTDVQTIATSIVDEIAIEHSPCDVLLKFLQRFETLIRELGNGSFNLQERWQQQCTLTGQKISLASGDHLVSGFCRGIASDGAIQVETNGVVRSWFGGVVKPVA